MRSPTDLIVVVQYGVKSEVGAPPLFLFGNCIMKLDGFHFALIALMTDHSSYKIHSDMNLLRCKAASVFSRELRPHAF